MGFEPLISVVVPVYNMGEAISRCVTSVIEQTYRNFELILVDDGSKDDSLNICLKLRDKDNRIRVFHTENRGSGPARNFGIEQTEGEYVCFPDADDELMPDALENMVNALDEGNHDLVIAGYELINQQGKLQKTQHYSNEAHSGDDIRRAFSQFTQSKGGCYINGAPWIKLFDLKVIRQYGIEYPPLRRHQDTAFIVRYLSHTNSVHFINAVLYRHYTNDIRLVWEKFPSNYIEISHELNQIMTQTVLTWNPEDKDTIDTVDRMYVTRVVKSIELTYSKKQNLNGAERMQWLRNAIEKYGLDKLRIPADLDSYHRRVLMFLAKGKLRAALRLCRFKVVIEKKGYLGSIKSFIKGAKV